MSDKIKEISNKLEPIFKQYPVKYAGIFGSYARNEESTDSDVDILISFNKPISLLEFYNLKNNLSNSINKKIDLVSEGSIVPYFKDYIYSDLIKIYE